MAARAETGCISSGRRPAAPKASTFPFPCWHLSLFLSDELLGYWEKRDKGPTRGELGSELCTAIEDGAVHSLHRSDGDAFRVDSERREWGGRYAVRAVNARALSLALSV